MAQTVCIPGHFVVKLCKKNGKKLKTQACKHIKMELPPRVQYALNLFFYFLCSLHFYSVVREAHFKASKTNPPRPAQLLAYVQRFTPVTITRGLRMADGRKHFVYLGSLVESLATRDAFLSMKKSVHKMRVLFLVPAAVSTVCQATFRPKYELPVFLGKLVGPQEASTPLAYTKYSNIVVFVRCKWRMTRI